MKYLEEPSLSLINSYLSLIENGDRLISGRVEAFSCKKQKDERMYAKNLEEHLKNKEPMIRSTSLSPFKNVTTDAASRKTFIDLISTLNATYPDYDFSTLCPESFIEIKSSPRHHLDQCSEWIHLTSCTPAFFTNVFWNSINDVIGNNYKLYKYCNEDVEESLWSLSYFFVSKTLKKILYFHISSKMATTD